MTNGVRYTVKFTPAARRRLDKLPLEAACALYEHLIGPVAGNPRRLGKPLEAQPASQRPNGRSSRQARRTVMVRPVGLVVWVMVVRSVTGAARGRRSKMARVPVSRPRRLR